MLRVISSLLVLLAVSATCVSGQSASAAATANDILVLNYALTLENLEAAFYNLALGTNGNPGMFTATSFAAYPSTTFAYLQIIQAHENQHVVALASTINGLQAGAAVGACQYNFGAAMASAATFIQYAAIFENLGQTAYDGAINGLSNPQLAMTAASIATIEARHAAYLNELVSVGATTPTSPFPSAFDTANNASYVIGQASPFIVRCPTNITLPSVRPSGVALVNGNTVKTGNPAASISTSYTSAQMANDTAALNFALTLEYLEASFYNYTLATFQPAQFVQAGYPANSYAYTQMITMHENIHVQTLIQVINGRQANAAVGPCFFNFSSINTVAAYFATAQLLENTGVMAYDGAVNTITDTNLQQVAATIATVEARHAAFLNQLANSTTPAAMNGVPFPPYSLDPTMTPTQILNAVLASGLVINCTVPSIPSGLPPTPSVVASQAYYVNPSSSSGASSSSSSSSSSSTGNTASVGQQLPSFLVQAALAVVFLVASLSL